MITRTTPTSSRATRLLALAAVSALAVSACDDGNDSEPDTTVVDELQSDPDVPFDPNVEEGIDTGTDQRGNMGFDVDDPGPVGNPTSPTD
jgi:hypothetical protein